MTYEEAIEILKHEHDYAQLLSYVNEAIKIAISSLEKQIPKKVEVTKYDIGGNNYFCHCGNKLRNGAEYCDMCGCKLDWSDTE